MEDNVNLFHPRGRAECCVMETVGAVASCTKEESRRSVQSVQKVASWRQSAQQLLVPKRKVAVGSQKQQRSKRSPLARRWATRDEQYKCLGGGARVSWFSGRTVYPGLDVSECASAYIRSSSASRARDRLSLPHSPHSSDLRLPEHFLETSRGRTPCNTKI